MKKTIAILSVTASSAVVISVLLYLFSPLGAVTMNVGYQLSPWDINLYTNSSEKIVIGKVVSVENKVIDNTFSWTDPETGQKMSRIDTKPYYFVTIEVEKYLVDKAGEYQSILIFRDPHVNGIFFINGQKVDIRTEFNSKYNIGEKALFFVYRSGYDEKPLESSRFLNAFIIDESSGTALNPRIEETKIRMHPSNSPQAPLPPEKLADFEREINQTLKSFQ